MKLFYFEPDEAAVMLERALKVKEPKAVTSSPPPVHATPTVKAGPVQAGAVAAANAGGEAAVSESVARKPLAHQLQTPDAATA